MKKSYLFIFLILVLALMFCLVSCNAPKTAVEGMAKMEGKGYRIVRIPIDEINEVFQQDMCVTAAIDCFNDSTGDKIRIMWFINKEKAESMSDAMSSLKGYLSQWEMFLGKEIKYKVSGTVFYYGTEQACKDFHM